MRIRSGRAYTMLAETLCRP